MKPLTKKALEQLSKEEVKELARLERKHAKLTEQMIKAQSAYTVASRECYKNMSTGCKQQANLMKLADKGFKLEFDTMQANRELTKYQNKLIKKYK